MLSPGNDGKVTQSNSTTAVAAALNANKTDQSIDQSQTGGGHGGSYLQVAGQGAWSKQDADAGAAAFQFGASNENTPIREGSPGGGGSVEQSNEVTALAAALNLNETCQRLMQSQTGYGSDSVGVGPGLVGRPARRGVEPRDPGRREEEAEALSRDVRGGRRTSGGRPRVTVDTKMPSDVR